MLSGDVSAVKTVHSCLLPFSTLTLPIFHSHATEKHRQCSFLRFLSEWGRPKFQLLQEFPWLLLGPYSFQRPDVVGNFVLGFIFPAVLGTVLIFHLASHCAWYLRDVQ